jgi:hypothetical protein
MYLGLRVKCPLFQADVNQIWIYSRDFLVPPISKIYEIHPVEAVLIHADRQTDGRMDMKKARGAFRDI